MIWFKLIEVHLFKSSIRVNLTQGVADIKGDRAEDSCGDRLFWQTRIRSVLLSQNLRRAILPDWMGWPLHTVIFYI